MIAIKFFEQPARLLNWFYSLTHDYILSIAMIALVVMLVTAPLVLKSTKGMLEMQKLQPERLVCAVGAQAAAERCLEITVEYAKERRLFGKPLSKFQNTQFVLAELAAEIAVGRSFVDNLIRAHMEGKSVMSETCMAKFWVTEMAKRVADRCLQIFGGYGYCAEYLISRFYVDARIQTIYAGTSEVMKMIIARFMGL